MSDQDLMQSIRTEWGATIAAACHASSVPESFLAALVANESGGKADAKRFEPAVFAHLAAVLVGEQKNYGSLGIDALVGYIISRPGPADFTNGLRVLRSLATSQGLVQIMGYEAIAFHLDGVNRLQAPESELPVAIKMLTDFAERFQLDVTKDFFELFDCWNTGRPHAPTADPNYVPNGLSRKQLYEALA